MRQDDPVCVSDALDWLVPRFLTSSALPFGVSLETFAAQRACADSDLGNFALQLYIQFQGLGGTLDVAFTAKGPRDALFKRPPRILEPIGSHVSPACRPFRIV
jgi:hypothetical protein